MFWFNVFQGHCDWQGMRRLFHIVVFAGQCFDHMAGRWMFLTHRRVGWEQGFILLRSHLLGRHDSRVTTKRDTLLRLFFSRTRRRRMERDSHRSLHVANLLVQCLGLSTPTCDLLVSRQRTSCTYIKRHAWTSLSPSLWLRGHLRQRL